MHISISLPLQLSLFHCFIIYPFIEKQKDFLDFLFIKTELEQGGNKPGFYAVLGVLVDMSVFNSGGSDSLAAAVPPGFWG